jgi:hypothetical protein
VPHWGVQVKRQAPKLRAERPEEPSGKARESLFSARGAQMKLLQTQAPGYPQAALRWALPDAQGSQMVPWYRELARSDEPVELAWRRDEPEVSGLVHRQPRQGLVSQRDAQQMWAQEQLTPVMRLCGLRVWPSQRRLLPPFRPPQQLPRWQDHGNAFGRARPDRAPENSSVSSFPRCRVRVGTRSRPWP